MADIGPPIGLMAVGLILFLIGLVWLVIEVVMNRPGRPVATRERVVDRPVVRERPVTREREVL